MTQPSNYEQYMLELVNRARLDFDAEINRIGLNATVDEDGDGNIDYQDTLNYGRQEYISKNGLDPSRVAILTNGSRQMLAFNSLLTNAARSHTQWIFDTNIFSHYETDSSVDSYTGYKPSDRVSAAGYDFSSVGENISIRATTGTPDVLSMVESSHQGLFTSFGHRLNIMNDTYRELGVGIDEGIYTSDGKDFNGVVTTQKFGLSGSAIFLTGVAYDDLITDDDFYSIGEGLRGILVTVEDRNSEKSFTTTTMSAGGYQIPLVPGTYNVSFSLGGEQIGITETVIIDSQNVKLDLNTDSIVNWQNLDNRSLITGTGAVDKIIGDDSNQVIKGYGGSDILNGGDGNDTLYGVSQNDTLIGGLGDDFLMGGSNNDLIIGVNPLKENPGYLEQDKLRGDGGADIFVLGDGDSVYYNYGGTKVESFQDRAIILDFNPSEDKIQLHGKSNNYRLGKWNNNTTIYYGESSTKIEVIGTIKGVTELNLSDSAFIYTDNDSLIKGTNIDNKLYGSDTNQKIIGYQGDDFLHGGFGDDTLYGGSGNDTLIGTNASKGYSTTGEEVDRLTGSSGNDIFVLGDANGSYYENHGYRDRVIIYDYSLGDSIQLYGSSNNYQLNELANGSTKIFHGESELIGVIKGVVGLDLSDTSQFIYT